MKPAVVFFVLAVLIAGAGFAEITGVDSLEWMTIDSQLVVKGTVTKIADVEGHDSFRDVTIAIDDTLKGEGPGKNLVIRVQVFDNPQAWRDRGHAYLFFLVAGNEDGQGRPLTGQWTRRAPAQFTIDLDEPRGVYNGDMTPVTESEEILKIVRAYARRVRARPGARSAHVVGSEDDLLWIPTEALTGVISMSCAFIRVPAEEKYRAVAMRLARSDMDRREGAGMLRYYPGPETIEVLVGLLDDPQEAISTGDLGELRHITYPVRQAAYGSLVALGEKVEQPILEHEPTDAEKKAFRDEKWQRSMKAVLPEDWEVVSVSVVESPGHGWKRTAGGDGVAVECRNRKASLDDEPKPMPGHPSLTLYAMPRDWEGEDTRNGGKIADNRLVRTRGTLMIEQPDQAVYLGHNGQLHLFYVAVGFDPRDALTRYFGLKIHEAAPDDADE